MVDYIISGYQGASLVSTRPILPKRRQVGGGPRGRIKTFSKDSRCRMMQKVGSIETRHLEKSLFLTVTYPAHYPTVERAKRDFSALRKRIMRKYPQAAGLVRLEFQERGAPHFHALILGVDFMPHEWLAQVWADICGYEGEEKEKHQKAGTEVRRIYSHYRAVAYISKYLAKTEQVASVEGVGRFWAVFGEIENYQGALFQIVTTLQQAAQIARVLDGVRLASARAKSKNKEQAIVKARDRRSITVHKCFWFSDVDSLLRYLIALS